MTLTPTIEPKPLFGVEFRCIYMHSDGEVCGHKCQDWFCIAHVNAPREGDNVVMGEDRLVPKAKGSFNRCPTIAQMVAHIQWVVCIRAAQADEVRLMVEAAAREVSQVQERRPTRRLLSIARKAMS